MNKNIIIGLEIHVELNTQTKLFCGCSTQGSDEPNSRCCEICLGHPGSKPVVNKKAIEYAIKLALALNCKIAPQVIFSRKSYFYPDMSKNYQITQYETPIGEKGILELFDKKINITRVHLEEDPAALVHPLGIGKSKYVLIDYNRCGNPLCEIVTEPELFSPKEARDFMKSLITVLSYLKIFDINNNLIKADANISIKESGYIRAEVKNITGFKEIEKALEYEIARQKQLVKENKKLIQETRSWDSKKGITSSLRTKETQEDYGYIYDPDLVPIDIINLDKIKKEIPELPDKKIKRYEKLNVSKEDAFVLSNDFKLTKFFEKAILKVEPALAAKWIRRELVRVMNYAKKDILSMDENQFVSLLELLNKKEITDKVGQKILEKLAIKNFNVKDYIKNNSLKTVADNSELKTICKEAIAECPQAVKDYKLGKLIAINSILGCVMRKTQGTADPVETRKILQDILDGKL